MALVFLSGGNFATAKAATPTVKTLTPVSTQVGRYQKFEADFSITRDYPADSFLPYYFYDASDTPGNSSPDRRSPYGVDGITINAVITAPSGRQITLPAFYYQDYIRSNPGNEVMTPTTKYSWKLRFAPEETGNYTYYITIQDKEGSSRYPATGNLSFTSVASGSKGFVRVSQIDPRFMVFSNNQSFIPIASGRQWWNSTGRSYDYETTFNTWKQYGINFTRIWDQNDSYNLTTEGHFDAYSFPDDFNPEDNFRKTGDPKYNPDTFPKGTQINQRGAYEKDKIIESAEKNDVYIELSSHNDPWWIWDRDIWSGYSFDDPQHIKYWMRNFRYRVARWGYSTSIMAWETWNEHGHITPQTDEYAFYQIYSQYQKTTDPYNHLRTTSQNSQAFSPGMWSSPMMDIVNYHDYLDFRTSLYQQISSDEASFIYNFAWCLRNHPNYCSGLGLGDGTSWSGGPKPIIWGEIGTEKNGSFEPNPTFLHNIAWAGLFSPMGSVPIDWYFDYETSATTNSKYASRLAASRFFSTIDFAASRFVFLMGQNDRPANYSGETIQVSNDNAKARVYAMRREDRNAAYLWVQHRDNTWYTSPQLPQTITPSLTIGNMANNSYTIEFWNTRTGQITSTLSSRTPVSGSLTFSLPGFNTDLAVKIYPGNSPLPTPAPTVVPTQPVVTPSPTIGVTPAITPTPSPTPIPVKNGDADGNGTVNANDIRVVLAAWSGSAAAQPAADQVADGKINSLDVAAIMARIGGPTPTSSPVNSPTPTPTRTPTPTPTFAPLPTSVPTPSPTLPPAPTPGGPTPTPAPYTPGEWSQHGHDPQHTGYTSQVVNQPWRWKWAWNGPNSSGTITKVTSNGRLPRNVEPITGSGLVFVAAGSDGIYALNQSSGAVAWSRNPGGSINSTLAYDSATNSVFAVSTNGYLYKLNAANGSTVSSFSSNGLSTLPLPPVISGNSVFFSMGNYVYSVNKNTMSQIWAYNAGNAVDTPPAYSSSRNLVLAVTSDLRVHGINNSTGSSKWVSTAVSSQYSGGNPADYNCTTAEVKNGWPVIADNSGYGFIKLRQCWNMLWQTNTNAVIAVSLDTGSRVLSNMQIGPGGYGDGGNMPLGPMPVVKRLDTGKEVLYAIIRGRPEIDVRWDSHFGQIALENGVVSGLSAGQSRPIFYEFAVGRTPGTDYWPTDEQPYLTMAGDYLFGGHWMAGISLKLTNPLTSSMTSSNADTIISSTANCPLPSHYQSGILTQVGDSRDFTKGFCQYRNLSYVYDDYWSNHAVWVVSNNLILFRSNDGAIIALENGNP